MTEAEIIKSYELCFAEKGTTYTCAVCPYHSFGELCKVERDKDAFEFIKNYKANIDKCISIICKKEDMEQLISRERQQYYDELQAAKAENERLKAENGILSKNADTAFQDGLNEAQEVYAEQIKKEVKAEAVKEFSERLKEALNNVARVNVDDFDYFVISLGFIDNLVKEMVGDSE
ncbi:MAG: hypothetical protein IKJ88_00860 [Clostridia bacterium]|nr:hypothetical protein [Clostridia bacterium]